MGKNMSKDILEMYLLKEYKNIEKEEEIIKKKKNEIKEKKRWNVILRKYVWGEQMKGKEGMFGRRKEVKVKLSEILDNMEMQLMGNIEVKKGKMGLYIEGK